MMVKQCLTEASDDGELVVDRELNSKMSIKALADIGRQTHYFN